MSKTNRILLAVLAAVALITVVGLAVAWLVGRGDDGEPANPLVSTRWQVRSYARVADPASMISPLPDTQLTAEFDGIKVAGSLGCNTYTAGYAVDGNALAIAKAALSGMFCEQPAGLMDQETAFVEALESARSFELETDQLRVLNDQGQVVIDFVPYRPVAEATKPPLSTDDSWSRIQAAGKIVVGTAADYPPFEFYVTPHQIDGFDIALMNEIGRHLGVGIEYYDFAFEGLGPALNQGQIDVAIAAISRTPEREALVDFSNIYLVSEDGILARDDSSVTVASPGDVAGYRVGVQRNTVYQDWIQSTLIDVGLMSSDNLFAYEKAEHALQDLNDGRIELVILDGQAAQASVEQGGVKIIAKGRGRQHYAIALTKGAFALKAKLDEAISDLYDNGTVDRLAQQYLDVGQLLPTPTPGPTSTPGPQPPCTDGLALVRDLPPPERVKPGQTFVKAWQVRNTGTCTWNGSYQLVFVHGYQMGGEPVVVAGNVSPGETYDLQTNLVAPLSAGSYQGVWQMVNPGLQGFGERLNVDVTVQAPPTVTPEPTQTPAPGIGFSVDRTDIRAGECVTFDWEVENVKAVYFYQEGERWQDYGVPGQGSRRECPPTTTSYRLRVLLRDDTVEIRKITIFVEPVADAPAITRFTVDPAGQITLGQCVTVRWAVEGELDNVTLSASENMLWDPAPAVGNTFDCPERTGVATYELVAVGPGGTSRQAQSISVMDPATATPEPTSEPDVPVIHAFDVSPSQLQVGECIALYWRVGGGAAYSRILRDQAVVVDDADYNGQEMDCLDTGGSYTYVLESRNHVGQWIREQRSVQVNEEAWENPLAGTRWLVRAFFDREAGGVGTILRGTTLTMAFDGDGEAYGTSGCNSYSASYLVEGRQLTLTAPTSTSLVCERPAGIMDQEAAFLELLPAITGYAIEGETLTLEDVTGQNVVELLAY